MLESVGCSSGPKNCGANNHAGSTGEFCGAGQGCFKLDASEWELCLDVAQWQCFDECSEGEVLNPLQYCKCIPETELYGLFCAAEATDEPDSDGKPMQMSGLEIIQRLRNEQFVLDAVEALYTQRYFVAAATGTLSLAQRQGFVFEKYFVALMEAISFAALAGHKGWAPKSISEGSATIPEPIGGQPNLFDNLLGATLLSGELLLNFGETLGLTEADVLKYSKCVSAKG